MAANEYQTLRIRGLPLDAKAEDVVRWLKVALGSQFMNVKIGPLIQASSSQSTIVTFANAAEAKRALTVRQPNFPNRTGQYKTSVEIDHRFDGFTTIYKPLYVQDHEPDVDIVLIHDAYGHPINSFASHYVTSNHGNTAIEKCWPRDDLPRRLEAEGVFPHVASYGWPASSWLKPDETCQRAVEEFTTHLWEMRVNAQRPIVFIGHGLGGILAKYAVSNMINFGLGEDDFQNPVKLCVFLGVPHHGLKQDDDFVSILENIKGLSITSGSSLAPTPELRRWNTPMRNISKEFAQLQSMYGINVVSLTEKINFKQ